MFCSNNLLTDVQKKRDRLLCSAFHKQMPTFTYKKKRDCLLLFRFTRLWYCPFIPNKQHRSPRRICLRTRVPIKYTRQESHILRTSIAAMPWNKIEFTRFRKAKNKLRMTPFFIKCRKPWLGSLVKHVGFPRGDTSHPLNPDVGLSTAKIQHFFELRKK